MPPVLVGPMSLVNELAQLIGSKTVMFQTVDHSQSRSAEKAPAAPSQERVSRYGAASTAGYSGNQAALRRLAADPPRIQRKLEVGAANDPLEAAADRTAERVLRMPDSAASSASITGGTARAGLNPGGETGTRPQGKNGGETTGSEAPRSVYEVLGERGRPLDAPTRAFFEPRFGRDLSQIRIHQGSRATASANAIRALAYTDGMNIVLGSGSFRPESAQGRFIMAHELAHSMQQERQRTIRRIIRTDTNAPLDDYLKGKSISGYANSGGSYTKARGTQPIFFEQEILLDMLASARLFEVAGSSSDDVAKSLNDHLKARVGIVTFAALKKYAFASVAGFKMSPKYWDVDASTQSWKMKPGVNKQDAWDDVNNNPQDYAIGCQAASIITQAGGSKGALFRDQPSTDEKDWVAGDAGYVSNPNHPKNAGPGTLGENLIYIGSGNFWGHLPGNQSVRPLADWKTEVASWDGASKVDSIRDGPVTGLL